VLLSLEKRGWEKFEKLSLYKPVFQIPLDPPFPKGEKNTFVDLPTGGQVVYL